MRFLSVRPDFCRRLPSDSTSRWTPLPLAICFPSLGRIWDFHPLEHAHAGRTMEMRVPQKGHSHFHLSPTFHPQTRSEKLPCMFLWGWVSVKKDKGGSKVIYWSSLLFFCIFATLRIKKLRCFHLGQPHFLISQI